MLRVYKPGADIVLAGSVPGKVIQACISSGGIEPHVQYQVSWFDGRTRHVQWVEWFEVSLAEAEDDGLLAVGFHGVS